MPLGFSSSFNSDELEWEQVLYYTYDLRRKAEAFRVNGNVDVFPTLDIVDTIITGRTMYSSYEDCHSVRSEKQLY
jgi:hypothetical protein